jgi:hypothetical protein
MKRHLILLLLFLQSISCNTNDKYKTIDENCYIVLNSVSNVIVIYDERNAFLTKMLNEIRNESKINAENLLKIEKLTKEIQQRLTTSLKILETKHILNRNEEIFDVSIKYLKKVEELEKIVPLLIIDLSDTIPNTNIKLKESTLEATNEVKHYGQLYHNAMNKYYKKNDMSNKKLDSIEALVEENSKIKI